MKRIKAFLMAGIMVLSLAACGDSDDEAVVGLSIEKLEDIAPVEEATVEATVEEVVDEDAAPREGMVRSYFTNEWVDAEVNETRPLAVMYPINKEAQPQYGLSNVAVFYEIMEEGEISNILQIGEILVSSEVLTEHFCCDYATCRGACCIIGDSCAMKAASSAMTAEEGYLE